MSIKKLPTFSIVIPMFNASKTIRRALDSCVSQCYPPLEIIVVDDDSSDESDRIVEQYRTSYTGPIVIKLMRLEHNSGPSKARNIGWDIAKGSYISFLDADDYFTISKLSEIADLITKKNSRILIGHYYGVDKEEKSSHVHIQKLHTLDFVTRNILTTSAVTVKKEVRERFDASMRYTEDHDLFLRITQKYNNTCVINKILVYRDRNMNSDGGLSSNLWAMRKGEIKMYYKFCKTNNLMIVFPIFFGYSLAKHIVKSFKGRN